MKAANCTFCIFCDKPHMPDSDHETTPCEDWQIAQENGYRGTRIGRISSGANRQTLPREEYCRRCSLGRQSCLCGVYDD